MYSPEASHFLSWVTTPVLYLSSELWFQLEYPCAHALFSSSMFLGRRMKEERCLMGFPWCTVPACYTPPRALQCSGVILHMKNTEQMLDKSWMHTQLKLPYWVWFIEHIRRFPLSWTGFRLRTILHPKAKTDGSLVVSVLVHLTRFGPYSLLLSLL